MNLAGQDVLAAFKSDLESFFYPNSGFVMNTAIKGHRTRYIGSAEKGGVVVSEDFAHHEVKNLDDFFFLLLVLGHEAAHLLNVHGGYIDQSNDETRALEVWADFFGTKVAMVVMTIGAKTLEMVTSLPGGDRTGDRVDAIGEAIGRLAMSYFDTHDSRYEPAPIRVAICVAGVMSALDTFWKLKGIPRDVKRSLNLQLRLYKAPTMQAQLKRFGAGAPDRSQIPVINKIHQLIQGERTSITEGMHPIPLEWLKTDYSGNEDERIARAEQDLEHLKAELLKLGLDIPNEL